ncbi:MAG: class I SAM-dependent methyltransferase [Planctomycetota bacterium]|jgi:SAM-dependent methyltransferase
MNSTDPSQTDTGGLFSQADLYDRSINWSARIAREVPLLIDVFGPPGNGGIIDAGCGTGRQACALAEHGYRVVGTDSSEEMLDVARRLARCDSREIEFVHAPYAETHHCLGGGFDGVYCLGNALAAASTRDAVAEAIEQFGRCLHTGSRLFVQVLNFELIRRDVPHVRGPRVANVDGRQYVSVRHFQFFDDYVQVTNVTLWHEGDWQQRSHVGRLYPVSLDELRAFCGRSHLRVDEVWGSYARDRFDVGGSTDLLVVATRV